MKIASAIAAVATLASTPATAQGAGADDARGELLYSTYCIGCHTTQMHWREQKLATDWGTLRAQVGRWQRNAAPGLSDDDVVAIARYLNRLYYRFPESGAAQAAWPDASTAERAAAANQPGGGLARLGSAFSSGPTISIGSGNTIVVFLSAPITVSVSR